MVLDIGLGGLFDIYAAQDCCCPVFGFWVKKNVVNIQKGVSRRVEVDFLTFFGTSVEWWRHVDSLWCERYSIHFDSQDRRITAANSCRKTAEDCAGRESSANLDSPDKFARQKKNTALANQNDGHFWLVDTLKTDCDILIFPILLVSTG